MGEKWPRAKLQRLQQKQDKKLKESLIPRNAAEIKGFTESSYLNNYRLIFGYYDHTACEMNKFSNFQPLLNKFDLITRMNKQTFQNRDSLKNSGDYSDLYDNLEPDVNLEELGLGAGGRIIFFRIKDYFCIRAILVEHRK